jgi:hypothetical protein
MNIVVEKVVKPRRMNKASAAAYLGISGRKLQMLVADRSILPVFDRGKRTPMFLTEELDAYVDGQKASRGAA